MIRPMLSSSVLLAFVLAGCADIGPGGAADALGPPGASAVPGTGPVRRPVIRGSSSSAASLDTVSDEQKAAARQAAAASTGAELGQETVALGSPTDPGLWVKTGLVSSDVAGTVRSGGEAIAVTLRPLGSDGGAQISLAAMRALGLPLTGLQPVTLARAG